MYIIIVGGGEIGYYLARALLDEGHEVLVRKGYVDRDGNIWVGTHGAGLFRLERGRADPDAVSVALAADNVDDILETSDGSLWVATRSDSGLVQIRDPIFIHISFVTLPAMNQCRVA